LIVDPATPHRITPERVGLGLLVAAAVMVPWLYLLSSSLPGTTRVSGWSRAWVGLDVMEGFALLGTGLLLLRRDPRVSPVAAVTAALLLVDAWFDVTTSSSGRALVIALAMALLVELPLCALCALIASRWSSSPPERDPSSAVGANSKLRTSRKPNRPPRKIHHAADAPLASLFVIPLGDTLARARSSGQPPRSR
jgi:hypothetical protein